MEYQLVEYEAGGIEYQLVEYEAGGAPLSLRPLEFLPALQNSSEHVWHPENAAWQIESPYDNDFTLND
ncbi:hypothetical protein T484DRAFT_1830965 [Baffinella frigidus]|nr:hypothetical protein T484DRAFT_1830965 [Cryptophyta sp. CCMP2293]